jgi:hypothetical protein
MGEASLLGKYFDICHEAIMRYTAQGVGQLGISVTDKERQWLRHLIQERLYGHDRLSLRVQLRRMTRVLDDIVRFFFQRRGRRHGGRYAARKETRRQPCS